jgi:F-type H+-transporting ATPase subunit gamma
MATLLDFKRRIRSVKNTQQITRAMKFVAAARLRRAQEKAYSARPYARAIMEVVRSAALRATATAHPLLESRPEKRVLLVAVSGERGLCGAFNSNVMRRAIEFLRGRPEQELEVIALGRKGRDALRKQSWKLAGEYVGVTSRAEYAVAAEIAKGMITRFHEREIDAVYMIFNEFRSVLSQNVTLVKVLPIEAEAAAGEHEQRPGAETAVDYLYEQPSTELLARLLPRYVEAQLYHALAESAASEHAARMTAMDSATNNAEELIDHLTLHMNKVRQAAITKEIIEVVSGAASAG